jgi:hypothetical protein
MKYKFIHILFAIIIFLLLVRFLYYLCIHYNKNCLINTILKQWKIQTNNGKIEKLNYGVYTNDYLLFFSETDNPKTHVHLVTNKFYSNFNEFISLFFKPQFEIIPTVTIGYIIKKNNKYLSPIQLNQEKDPDHIVKHIIATYKAIDMY